MLKANQPVTQKKECCRQATPLENVPSLGFVGFHFSGYSHVFDRLKQENVVLMIRLFVQRQRSGFESEFLLRKITEKCCYDCDEHFRRSWVEMGNFDKKLQTGIIQSQIYDDDQQIPAKLNMTSQIGSRKSYVFLQKETRHERNRKCQSKCRNMRTHGYKTQVKHLMAKYEIVNYKIQNPVENHVRSSGYSIAKKL